MEKIILFGASRGGENFIKNLGEFYDIIAIADNDREKHGKSLNNIEIINPSTIKSFTFDKVMITSLYFRAISQQLINIGVPKELIDYAPKNAMKVIQYPFSKKSILYKAENLIRLLSDILEGQNYYYTFGTALGMVRDHGLIPWDDDIDLSIHANDFEIVKRIIIDNIEKFDAIIENEIVLRKYENEKVASISINCLEGNQLLFNINLDFIYTKDDYAILELDKIPLKFFNKPSDYLFKGIQVKLPTQYKDYLTHVYKDWHIIKKNTNFMNNTTTYVEPTLKVFEEVLHKSKDFIR